MNKHKQNFIIEHHPFLGCAMYLILSFCMRFFIDDVFYVTCLVDFMFYAYILYRRKRSPIIRDKMPSETLPLLIFTVVILLVTTYFWSCWYMSNMSDSSTSNYTDVLANANIYVYIFTVSIAAPFGEESLFRYIGVNGFLHLFAKFKKPLQYTFAILASAFIFAIMHGTGVHLLIGFFSGVALALVYLYTNNLGFSIITHMCYNMGTMFFQIPNSFAISCLLTIISVMLVVCCVYKMTKND